MRSWLHGHDFLYNIRGERIVEPGDKVAHYTIASREYYRRQHGGCTAVAGYGWTAAEDGLVAAVGPVGDLDHPGGVDVGEMAPQGQLKK